MATSSPCEGWFGTSDIVTRRIFSNQSDPRVTTGDDTVVLGAAGEVLDALAGADSIIGDSGDDIVFGNDGADTLTGSGGSDFLSGGGAADIIDGGTDADILQDGDGAGDTLEGGTNDDTLDGGSGRDALNGNAGDDAFIFALGYSKDIVSSYDQGQDRVVLNEALWIATRVRTVQDVLDDFGVLSASGYKFTLDFGGGDILVLKGSLFDLGKLASDFSF